MDIQETISRARRDYKDYLREKHPDWAESTLSTHVSDAFYLYQNTIALSFWKCFESDESMAAAKQDILDYLKNDVMSERSEERAAGYFNDLKMLKEFLDAKGGVRNYVGPEYDCEVTVYKYAKMAYDGALSSDDAVAAMCKEVPFFGETSHKLMVMLFASMMEGIRYTRRGELNTDVSLRVEETDSTERFKVSGRGELHLSVLIENMRREGYEFAVSKAEVLYHYDEHGKKLEPMERAYIDVDDEYAGNVIQKLGERKGELINMHSNGSGSTRLEFLIPARGLIGYRGEFMTDTKGTGVLNTIFENYGPYKGDIQYRKQGSLIAFEAGEAITYGLFNAQERGTLFIGPGEKVYAGMIIGQNGKAEDIELNVCKTKKLTNTRSSSADEALKLTTPRVLSLEQCLEFIDTDELLEITPKSLRIRKKILDPTLRKRAGFKKA